MNRTGVLSLLLLFGSLTLMAQTSGNQPTGSVVVRLARFQTNCGPIGIQARMDNSLNLLAEVNDRPTERVRITLNNANSVEIVASQITVHGVTTMSETPPAVPRKLRRPLNLTLRWGQGRMPSLMSRCRVSPPLATSSWTPQAMQTGQAGTLQMVKPARSFPSFIVRNRTIALREASPIKASTCPDSFRDPV